MTAARQLTIKRNTALRRCASSFAVSILGGLATGIYVMASMKSTAKALAIAEAEAAKALAIAEAETEADETAELEHKWQLQRELEQAEKQRQLEEAHAQMEAAAAKRFAKLSTQYGEETAKRIIAGRLWIDCTVERMIEMLGYPEATDGKVLKTNVKRTCKYHFTGANRYALRVYAEKEAVVGWEDKND
jgi:hypothetical protein